MNIKDQGHSVTLVQGHLDSHFQTSFSLDYSRPIEAKFHLEPPWDGDMKVCSNGLCHITSMAAMPIYGKNLRNILLWNQKADDLESSIGYSNSTKIVK